MKALDIDIQIASESKSIPSDKDIYRWVEAVLANVREEAELSIRIVDSQEGAELNERFRQKQGPTNVLSFAFEAPANLPIPLLGDIVICAPVVELEAKQQHKSIIDHWAHMIVHGTLHLLGYDHIQPQDALLMEGLEISIMTDLGLSNPYIDCNEEIDTDLAAAADISSTADEKKIASERTETVERNNRNESLHRQQSTKPKRVFFSKPNNSSHSPNPVMVPKKPD